MRAPWMLLLLMMAAPAHADPKVTRLETRAFGYAYWAFDGRSFYVLGPGGARLERFDADGKSRGAVPLAPELRPLDAYLRTVHQASRALSPDGKQLAFPAMRGDEK